MQLNLTSLNIKSLSQFNRSITAMIIKNKILSLPAMAAVLAVAWGNAQAHTRFETATIPEGARSDNNVMIPHGCADQPVIGAITVFPDVSTALVDISDDANAAIGAETFARSEQLATDFVQGISIAGIQSRDTFSASELIRDDNGNPVGVWSAGGSIPPSNWVAKLPVRISAVNIVPESCASKVILVPAIANVCQLTSLAEINGKDSDRLDVDFWTAPDAGHPNFDAPAWNFPAPITVTRNPDSNPLPASCGEGVAVRIYPSAGQLNRDLPVKIDGVQVWPAP